MKFIKRFTTVLLLMGIMLSVFPVAMAQEGAEAVYPAETLITDSNATYAPESAHIWTNKTLTEDDELGQYTLDLEAWVDNANLILEENIPLDVVFCIDQSASMYRPAYATKDLQCDDSFGASRTQESTPETIAATGEIPRAEFIQKMKTDAEFAERATHYGYYIARSAGHKDKPGAWFIIRYDAETGKFHGHRTCRTNHPSNTTGTYTCPDPKGTYGNHGTSVMVTWNSVDEIPEKIGRFYVTQYGMMYDAVLSFVETAKENADKNEVNHRFAFTTFSGISGENENGTGILIGNQRSTYDDISRITASEEKYALYSSALLSALDTEQWEMILQSVNTIKSDFSGTHTQAGMRLAKEILNQTKDDPDSEGRKRFVLLFTDGEPNMYFKPSDGSSPTFANDTEKTNYCKNKVISESFKIKKARDAEEPGLGAQIYTICTSGDGDGDFLKYVSSSYPAAVDMTNTGAYAGRVFYFLEDNAAGIGSVFAEIRDKELLDRAQLNGDLIMRDVISSDFCISSDNVTAYKVPYMGEGTFNEDPTTWIAVDTQTELTVDIRTDATEYGGKDFVEITGFDYASNCITDGTTPSGYKLLVRLQISAEDLWAAKKAVLTNDVPNSGIFGDEGKIIGFDSPSVDLPAHIYLKKTVAGEQADPDDTFHFDVTAQKYAEKEGLHYTSITHTESDGGTGNVLVTRGGNYLQANTEETTEAVDLKHEELKDIGPLEPGSSVIVQEATVPGYAATIKIEYADGREDEILSPDANGRITVAVEPGMTIHYINFAYPRPDTAVMDFGLPMNVHVLVNDLHCAAGNLVGVGELKSDLSPTTSKPGSDYATDYVGKYGAFAVKDNSLVYTPASMEMSAAEVVTYVVSQEVEGNLYYFYSTLTILPAASVYYEDSFVDFTGTWKTAGEYQGGNQGEDRPGEFEFPDYDTDNIYGYDPAYDNSTTYSLGSARYASVTSKTFEADGAWPTAKFTFTGTGFDLISLTSNQTGFITCRVYKGTQTETVFKSWVVDTYFGYTRTVDQEHPWIKYTGTYNGQRWTVVKEAVAEPGDDASETIPETPNVGDVVIFYKENYIWTPTTESGNDLYQIPVIKSPELDYGTYTVVITPTYIPFFDHTGSGGYDFYMDAVRIYAPAENMEDYYLEDGEAYPQYVELRKQLLTTDEAGNATGYVNGISFIDGVEDGLLSDYDAYGPNNEIYLNSNQAIAFAIDSKGQSIANVHVGVKIFDNPGTLTAAALDAKGNILAEQTVTTTSHTDLYYSISNTYIPVEGENISNVIVLTNTGSSPITLTTLKITYGEAPTADSELVMDLEKMQAAAGYVGRKVTIDLPISKELPLTMGHSVNFENDLQMNYRIKRSELEGYDLSTAYLVVEKDVYSTKGEMAVETCTLYPDLNTDAERVIFTLKGIQSVEMGSELRATLYISDNQGREVKSSVDTYSILAYAQLCFDSYSYEEQPTLYRLLMDILNYGAAAQLYFGRRTDSLVNAGMEAYQQYATDELAAELTDTKVVTDNSNSTLVSKLGFTVSFADRLELNAKLSLSGDAADITSVKVTDESGNTVATLTDFTQLSDGRLQVTYSGIKATQLRNMYYFTAYSGETAVSPTTGYSVEAYARSCLNSSDLALAALVRSCMYYGDSAANYFNEKGGESN